MPTTQYLTGFSGRSYCFGLKIYPISDNARVSAISGSTNSSYEIWRTWDDCLWFQELLETRYTFTSNAKRQRLRAGKGVKKNGIYIHDRAASFESLPPGPDPKSVAKNLYQYLPKLSQSGSFFGVNQATIDQRQDGFSAFIKALLADDVPALIKELLQDTVIRDFFGYWRRDYDLAVKRGRRPKSASSDGSVRTSFISSFFSTSSVSLSTTPPPISPRSPSLSQRSHITDPTLSLSDADSVLSGPSKPPSSAPARLGPRRSLSSPSRPKNSPSPRSETFNVTSDFPLFLSSSTRDLLPASESRPPHSPSYATPALETLPEDGVPDSSASDTPRLTLRNPSDFPVNNKRAHRNVVIFPDTDEVSSSEGDALERELLTPVDGPDFNKFVGRSTRTSCSSPPPSSTLSDFSSQSDGSYWRTSSENTWPSSASSNDSESVAEIDFPHMTCTHSIAELEGSSSPPMASSGISTLCGSSHSRRRSPSQPLPVDSSVPMDVGEEDWFDQGEGEDLMEAYLGGSQSIFAPNVRDSLSNYDNVPSDFPLDVPDDVASVISFSTSREKIPSIYLPPRALHRPPPLGTTSLTRPPPSSRSSRTMSMSSSCNAAKSDMLVVKAALDDAKVVLCVQRDAPLADLRQRVAEKFAQTEGTLLRGEFDLSYLPPSAILGGGGGAGKNRASTVSAMSTTSLATVDWTSAVPLRNEGDWETAIASCGSKITVRVTPE